MPGVLIIEGMAQTAGALCVSSIGQDYKAELVYFMGIDNAKFRKPVVPGDQLHYHVRKVRNRGRVWRFKGEAKVDGKIVAEAEISAMLADSSRRARLCEPKWLKWKSIRRRSSKTARSSAPASKSDPSASSAAT